MNEKIDPICGMEGKIYTDGKWFCSDTCVEKYTKALNLEKKEVCCKKDAPLKTYWYRDKLFVSIFIISFIFLLSIFVPILKLFTRHFIYYLKLIVVPLSLGLLIGGVVEYYVPKEYISKLLSTKGNKGIFIAVFLGFFMSACSHGILALSMQLHKKGSPVPSTIAFLLASPWANFTITVLFFGLFGAKAILIIISAIIIALTTGFIYKLLDEKNIIEKNPNTVEVPDDFSIMTDFKKRWSEYKFNIKNDLTGILTGAWELTNMILWWILLGITISSAFGSYIPENFSKSYLGPNLLGLLVTLGIASVLEVCSECTSPVAFEIYRQTGAFGNAFTFLMAGVATDYTEIGIVWNNIGKKSAILLPVITIPQIVVLGYLFNYI